MKIRTCLPICGLIVAGFLSASARADESSGKRPNIIYLFADQLRACSTGYGGDPDVRTPNLDSLAKESVNFRNAVSVCPVCTPHRAALLKGNPFSPALRTALSPLIRTNLDKQFLAIN